MICPYNGFKDMNCAKCVAERWVKNPTKSGYDMRACVIAYYGGSVSTHRDESKEEKND